MIIIIIIIIILMIIYIYIYTFMSIYLSLSLSIYIYIYIFVLPAPPPRGSAGPLYSRTQQTCHTYDKEIIRKKQTQHKHNKTYTAKLTNMISYRNNYIPCTIEQKSRGGRRWERVFVLENTTHKKQQTIQH